MKNCVIQNVGASNLASASKNVAINIYDSNGQHNFEGLVIRNVKTTLGLGIVSMNRATQNYFKDLTIDGTQAQSSANSIKIEDTDTGADVPFTTYKNVFAGALTLTQTGSQGYVYIERYQYARTCVPAEYRYARYSTSNGSAFASAINIYSSLPTASSSYAVLDLSDNYWVVRTDSAVSVENQIIAIRTLLSKVSSAGVPSSVPGYRIKLVTAASSIGTFSVPDLGNAPASLAAVKLLASGNPSAFDSTERLPLAANSAITLKSSDPSGIRIYNFDFDTMASITMKEAVSGVSLITPSDPNEAEPPAGYPIYSGYAAASTAKVSGSQSSTFVNCTFTALASAASVTDPVAELGLTQQATFHANVTGGYTDASTSASAASVNDASIRWYSSDPSVLSIDPLTGTATANALGTAVVTAKAIDSLNQGEIEKPFATFEITVRDLFSVSYNPNGSDSGTVPASVPVISGKTTIILPENDLIRAGYTFEGWNEMPDGTGTNYAVGQSVTVTAPLVLYAHWVKIIVVTPTPTATPIPSVTPEPSATPVPTAAPEPTATPTTVPALPTVTPTPTPASGVLGAVRTPSATPTDKPATGVLGVTKTGEKTNVLLTAATIALPVLAAVGIVILIIRKKKA